MNLNNVENWIITWSIGLSFLFTVLYFIIKILMLFVRYFEKALHNLPMFPNVERWWSLLT